MSRFQGAISSLHTVKGRAYLQGSLSSMCKSATVFLGGPCAACAAAWRMARCVACPTNAIMAKAAFSYRQEPSPGNASWSSAQGPTRERIQSCAALLAEHCWPHQPVRRCHGGQAKDGDGTACPQDMYAAPGGNIFSCMCIRLRVGLLRHAFESAQQQAPQGTTIPPGCRGC